MTPLVTEGLNWSEVIQQLLLARLLEVGNRPPELSKVRASLGALCRDIPLSRAWSEQFDESRQRCVAAGLIRERPLGLTDRGREICLEFWRIRPEQLPASRVWPYLIRHVLVPRLLGVPSRTLETKDPRKSLRIWLLRRRFGLPDSVRTEKQVMDALAWRELGIDTTAPFSAKGVVARGRLQLDRPLDAGVVLQHVVRSEVIPSERDLFVAVLKTGLAELASPSSDLRIPTVAVDLAEFAGRVTDVARGTRTGRIGEHKVFLSHVWRQLQEDRRFAGLTEEQFRERLVEAHRRQLLTLARADLVERMDPQDVAESEVRYLNGRFHFLCV